MKRITFILLAMLLLTMPQWARVVPATAAAAGGSLTELRGEEANCLFFTETAEDEWGFSVCDDDEANFRTPFERWGLQKIGYPVSARYIHDGFVTQAFQKAIMQWRVDGNYVALVNIFDDLHNAGFDDTLLSVRQTPRQFPAGWDGDIAFNEVIKKRQALLDARPALHDTYFASPDPLALYGLPTSEVQDMGNHYAIRLQRTVLQEWKEPMPWAKVGQVTTANGGDIAKELGALPRQALVPEWGGAEGEGLSQATTLFYHPRMTHIAWANDHTLAVAAADGIWLYDSNALDRDPQLLSESRCSAHQLSCVTGLTVSHNREWLAVTLGGERESLLLWSLTSLGEPKVLTDYPEHVSKPVISPNGRSVAFIDPFLDPLTESQDVHIWDVASGEVKHLPNDWGAVNALSFRSDGAVVMAAVSGNRLHGRAIRRFHVSNGEEMNPLPIQIPMAFSPDGQTAATRGSNLVQLWDLSSEPVTSRGFGAPLTPANHLARLTFSQDGSKLAAGIYLGSNRYNVEVWDLSTESLFGSVPTLVLMAWSPSGRFAAFGDTASTNNQCWFWDVQQNKRLAILPGRGGALYCPSDIAFSPNDRWLASTNGHLLKLLDIESWLEE